MTAEMLRSLTTGCLECGAGTACGKFVVFCCRQPCGGDDLHNTGHVFCNTTHNLNVSVKISRKMFHKVYFSYVFAI